MKPFTVGSVPVCAPGVREVESGFDHIKAPPANATIFLDEDGSMAVVVAGYDKLEFCRDRECYQKRKLTGPHVHASQGIFELVEATWRVKR